jgi:RHS repeat-associated protein
LDQRLYVQQDANWNVTALVDTSGNVVERYDYDPFGLQTVLNPDFTVRGTSAYAVPYGFQGMRTDLLVSVYFADNRVYSPTLMRWLQTDPIGLNDGNNDYAFEGNGPIDALDPSGLDKWSWEKAKKLAEADLRRKGVNAAEVELRLKILENTYKGKVRSIGDHRGPKWERHEDNDIVWYNFKDDPIGAILSVWEDKPLPDKVYCAPYTQLIFLKSFIDLASDESKRAWGKEWRGIRVNEIRGLEVNRFWKKLRNASGFKPNELRAGDNVWFWNSFYDKLTPQEIANNRSGISGEEGSNVLFIGERNHVGYVMKIYSNEVLTIQDYYEYMMTWVSAKIVMERLGLGYIDIDGPLAFPILAVRRPILTR